MYHLQKIVFIFQINRQVLFISKPPAGPSAVPRKDSSVNTVAARCINQTNPVDSATDLSLETKDYSTNGSLIPAQMLGGPIQHEWMLAYFETDQIKLHVDTCQHLF